MKIPLANRLKKRLHLEIAALQDEVVEIMYEIEKASVLHGGTAIWRCYGGNRFSEDLDFYADVKEGFREALEEKLKAHGFLLSKYKATENVIFAKVIADGVEVRLEINRKKSVRPVVREYERIDGTFMAVMTLSPEELLAEKTDAYGSRRLIRDIYDVYHLSGQADMQKVNKRKMSEFLDSIKDPLDESNLKAIVYTGAVPSFRQLVEVLRRRFAQ